MQDCLGCIIWMLQQHHLKHGGFHQQELWIQSTEKACGVPGHLGHFGNTLVDCNPDRCVHGQSILMIEVSFPIMVHYWSSNWAFLFYSRSGPKFLDTQWNCRKYVLCSACGCCYATFCWCCSNWSAGVFANAMVVSEDIWNPCPSGCSFHPWVWRWRLVPPNMYRIWFQKKSLKFQEIHELQVYYLVYHIRYSNILNKNILQLLYTNHL